MATKRPLLAGLLVLLLAACTDQSTESDATSSADIVVDVTAATSSADIVVDVTAATMNFDRRFLGTNVPAWIGPEASRRFGVPGGNQGLRRVADTNAGR
jgi:hypothetical protein